MQLKAGDARQLADAMTRLLNQSDTSKGGRPTTGGVRVEADAGTNSLLISAAPGDWPMVQKILDQLKASVIQQVTASTRQVPLKFAKASELANILRQVYSGQAARPNRPGMAPAVPVVIAASDQTNSLLISAAEDDQKDIAQLIKTMDVEPVEGANLVQVRTYRLGDSKATDVAASLNRLYQQQPQRGGAPNVPVELPPRFEADPSTNQLLVSATPTQFQQVEELIKKLTAGNVALREMRVFALKSAKASDMADMLTTMLMDAPRPGARPEASATDVRVAAMIDSNAVAVQGPPEKLALAEQIVKQFDNVGPDDVPQVVIVRLQNSQAATLADAINNALTDKTPPGSRPTKTGAEKTVRVTVTPEPNSNSLLVRGTSANVKGVVEMVKQLDAGSIPGGIQVRTFPVKNADPQALAASLGKFFQDMGRQQGGKNQTPVPFSIAYDDRTHVLVVSTTAANFMVVEQLLKTMDQEASGPRQDVTYLWLENAMAREVASQVNDMYRERKGADKPVVTPDEMTNTVTVVGKPADLAEIEDLVAKIDERAKDNSIRTRVIPLAPAMKADKMAEALRGILSQMNSGDGGDATEGGAAPIIEVTPTKVPPAPVSPTPAGSGGSGGGRGSRGGRGGGGGGDTGGVLFRRPGRAPRFPLTRSPTRSSSRAGARTSITSSRSSTN